MRLPQLAVLDLELFDQTMATHAATSIFIRILAHLFLRKSVTQEEQPVLCKNMQDCESNLMRFSLLLRVWLVERRSADIVRQKKGRRQGKKKGWLLECIIYLCLRARPRSRDAVFYYAEDNGEVGIMNGVI